VAYSQRKPVVWSVVAGTFLVGISLLLFVISTALVAFAQVFPAILVFAMALGAGMSGVTSLRGRPFAEPSNDRSAREWGEDAPSAPIGAVWFVSTLLAVVFGFSALVHLVGAQFLVEAYEAWQYPEGLRLTVGALQLVAAVAILMPRHATPAAAVLAMLMGGAVYTHLALGRPYLAFFPLVLLIAALYVGWERSATHRAHSGHGHAGHA
jgi:hypothetical protein